MVRKLLQAAEKWLNRHFTAACIYPPPCRRTGRPCGGQNKTVRRKRESVVYFGNIWYYEGRGICSLNTSNHRVEKDIYHEINEAGPAC